MKTSPRAALSVTALLLLASACKIEEGTTPPAQPLPAAPSTSSPTVSPPSTATPSATATAAPPPTATATSTPTAVSGACAADSDCPAGQHCAMGMPLRGRCWQNGAREPVCLAEDTRIATPKGEVFVRDLSPGAEVWTLSRDGARVAAKVGVVGHVPAPPGHMMVHVVMKDGRSVFASPGHPTCAAAKPAARTVAELAMGNGFDRSTVTLATRAPYTGTDTYDLLPEGDTGCYWANGVLLGSTVR